MPDFTLSVGEAMLRHPRFQVSLNGGLYAVLAEEACIEAGVKLRYYEFPMEVEATADGWRVVVVGKGTRLCANCRQLIDCTGNASVVALAGFERIRGEERQPGSIVFTLNKPSGWKHVTGFKHQRYVAGADASTSESHTAANVQGRQAFLKAFREMRQANGGQDVKLLQLQPETASRETWRIVGQAVLSQEDYESGRVFEDAVASMYYPIDLHTAAGVRPKHLREGTVVSIPLGALVPKGSRNLLVAGRCISSDRLANSGLRVQASCMAMGQAAGAAVALSVLGNSTPSQLSITELRRVLTPATAKPAEAPAKPVAPTQEQIYTAFLPMLKATVEAGHIEPDFAEAYPQMATGLMYYRWMLEDGLQRLGHVIEWIKAEAEKRERDATIGLLNSAIDQVAALSDGEKGDPFYAGLKEKEIRDAFVNWLFKEVDPKVGSINAVSMERYWVTFNAKDLLKFTKDAAAKVVKTPAAPARRRAAGDGSGSRPGKPESPAAPSLLDRMTASRLGEEI